MNIVLNLWVYFLAIFLCWFHFPSIMCWWQLDGHFFFFCSYKRHFSCSSSPHIPNNTGSANLILFLSLRSGKKLTCFYVKSKSYFCVLNLNVYIISDVFIVGWCWGVPLSSRTFILHYLLMHIRTFLEKSLQFSIFQIWKKKKKRS